MKNVYIAMAVFAIIFTIGQVRAGESSTLENYYSEYAVPILSAQEKAHQGQQYPGCKPYGDSTVGYFKTKEEYNNAYDPALFAQEY